MNGHEEKARGRFAAIQLVRLGGVAMVLAALLALNGRLGLPEPAGWVLLGLGLFEIFAVPQMLARAWRSPDQ